VEYKKGYKMIEMFILLGSVVLFGVLYTIGQSEYLKMKDSENKKSC